MLMKLTTISLLSFVLCRETERLEELHGSQPDFRKPLHPLPGRRGFGARPTVHSWGEDDVSKFNSSIVGNCYGKFPTFFQKFNKKVINREQGIFKRKYI